MCSSNKFLLGLARRRQSGDAQRQGSNLVAECGSIPRPTPINLPSSVTLARLTVYQQGDGEYPSVGWPYIYGPLDYAG